jgi:tetratricopeptide (TPR) repeat protein
VSPNDALQFEAEIDAALGTGDVDRAEVASERYCRAAAGETKAGEPARSPGFRAAYLAAQVSLSAGRLAQTVERLTPLVAVAHRLPDDLAARVRLFLAEALARLHRGAEARPLLRDVPAGLLARHPLLQLRALRIRLWLGEVTRLEDDLARCLRALEARGDTANGALLLCEEGRAWESAGDLERAERCWRRAEEASRPLGGDPIRADVLLQLGRLDHLRGRLPAALERYDEALAGAATGAQAMELRLRRLLVLLDVNQWPRARALADALLGGVPPEGLPEELRPLAALVRALLQGDVPPAPTDEQQAYAAASRGDAEAARALYLQALAAAPSPERQARLALALGLLALGQDERTDARSWLRQAEELGREHGLPEVLWRALQARGQVAAEWDGDEDEARRLFDDAVVISEVQAGQFRHGSDAVLYRQQCGGAARQLLRAACRRGDAAEVFRRQELDRGRLLLDVWRGAAAPAGLGDFFSRRDVTDLERRLADCEDELRGVPAAPEAAERRRTVLREREELKVRLDHLCLDFLRDRSRRGGAALPVLPTLAALPASLPPGTLFVAPALLDDELYLLTAARDGPARVVRAGPSAARLPEALDGLRGCLAGQLARYSAGLSLGRRERAELDARLDELGKGPLGDVLSRALAACSSPPRRLLWVPDGPLHGLPVHALRLRRDRYLIEDVEVAGTFSGALLVYQAQTRARARGPFGPALVVTETAEKLPEAAREGEGVAASFLRHRVLHGAAATRAALRRRLGWARVVHFACHAHFDIEHPLAAHVALPSGDVLRALEWLTEPVDGLPLVTLSACRSAAVAPLLGHEVFGLVTGLLGGGVRAVLAGLWPVADREALPLVWRFYRHRLTADLATALARAQRESLAAPDASPLYWAAFALFGDPAAVPAPGRLTRWLARWRQARHARRFPVP